MNADCQNIASLILDFEWLGEEEKFDVSLHVADCPVCAQKLETVEKLGSILQDNEPVKSPDGLASQIMVVIEGDVSALKKEPQIVSEKRADYSLWPLLAGVGFSGIAGYFLALGRAESYWISSVRDDILLAVQGLYTSFSEQDPLTLESALQEYDLPANALSWSLSMGQTSAVCGLIVLLAIYLQLTSASAHYLRSNNDK